MEKLDSPLLRVDAVFVFVLPQGFAVTDEDPAARLQSIPELCVFVE